MKVRPLAVLAVCAGVLGWHLLLRASAWRLPMIIDEGEYSYAARVWSAGGLPYRDASSQKPPMVLWLYRAGLSLGGAPAGTRALGLAAALLTCALLFAAAPRRWPAGARAAPAFAYSALSTLPVGDYGFPANTETFVCLFMAAAACCVTRAWDGRGGRAAAWAAAAGLCGGAALATKQTALFSVIALGALAAWSGERRASAPRAAAFLLGACAAPLAWAAYFAARGGLDALVEQALRGNVSYASAVGAEGLVEQSRWLLLWLGPKLLLGAWPAALLAALGLGGLQARWARREAVLAVLWLGAACAGVMTGLLFFPHYFLQAAAPLCLCAGFGAERLARGRGARAAWAFAAALALLPALGHASLYAELDPARLAKALLFPNPLVEARDLGAIIRRRTSPQDLIYVFGSEPQIYVYADRRAATPFTSAYMLTLRRPRPGEVDAELARLRAARPAFVVYSRQPLSTLIAHSEGLRFRDEIRAWLRSGYRPVSERFIERDPFSFRRINAAELQRSPVDFSPADALILFEREDRKTRWTGVPGKGDEARLRCQGLSFVPGHKT